ncbi:hypothetical protein VV01_07865 [Luteipulveratus halotolerans]|uniref:Uncharacterized protein n=1 Tax=Luteipulveratus halotolerans TaxID=1631356 RepID=A0A0L6CH00_9MICO|nr:hypothetical protein VV01_07865 [Luteipulveratus halotolerans]
MLTFSVDGVRCTVEQRSGDTAVYDYTVGLGGFSIRLSKSDFVMSQEAHEENVRDHLASLAEGDVCAILEK